jgi:hypothetical protein
MTRCTIETREIVSLSPLAVKVSAVFLGEDCRIIRSPQLALALFDLIERDASTDEELHREKGRIGFVDSVDPGEEFADSVENFLGYEIGEERDWSTEIASKSFKVTT